MTVLTSKSYKDRVFSLEELEAALSDAEANKELPEIFEVVEGKIVEMTPTQQEHGYTSGDIVGILYSYIRPRNLGKVTTGELGFRLKARPLLIRCPDVAFISKERVAKKGYRKGFFNGAPDLAIEVISPGNTAVEVAAKVSEYLEAGSKLVWVVYPDREEVHVYKPGHPVTSEILKSEDSLSGEAVIPGFSCRVAEFFE
jgi:Uma2 family endonuclease